MIAGHDKAIRVRPAMYGDGEWHLYDIERDPAESRPLDEEHPRQLEKMVALYEAYAAEKGIVPVADNWSPWHGFLDDAKRK